MNVIKSILQKNLFTLEDIVRLLQADDEEKAIIFKKAYDIKEKYSGNKVWLRALLEIANICKKNCYYCGIRKGNKHIHRYEIPLDELKNSICNAYTSGYNSLVLQSGENTSEAFNDKISSALEYASELTQKSTGITLSCGEQDEKTLQRWFDAGAERYLLRIETSNEELYYKIHPRDKFHDFSERTNCLFRLKKIGFQTGSGIMIGLPFQTDEDLARDLIFMQEIDIDMCGMGPYIEHPQTPLANQKDIKLPTLEQRANKTLLMIAVLRIIMKDINIAATTALHSINSENLVKAIYCGANVIMPNLTPEKYKENYFLYKNKQSVNKNNCNLAKLTNDLKIINHIIDYGKGNPVHFKKTKPYKLNAYHKLEKR